MTIYKFKNNPVVFLILSALVSLIFTETLVYSDDKFTVNIFIEELKKDVLEIDDEGLFKANARSNRLLGDFGLRLNRFIGIYARTGIANLNIPSFNSFRGGYGFVYGGRVRLYLYDSGRSNIYMDSGFLTFKTDSGVFISDIFEDEKIIWREYLFSLNIDRSYKFLRPYLNIHLLQIKGTDNLSEFGTITFKSKNNLGFTLGMDIFIRQQSPYVFYIEESFMDQKGIRSGVNIYF